VVQRISDSITSEDIYYFEVTFICCNKKNKTGKLNVFICLGRQLWKREVLSSNQETFLSQINIESVQCTNLSCSQFTLGTTLETALVTLYKQIVL
jgi:hypothetical protein